MREFSFVVDVAGSQYVVPQCDPPVAAMGGLVEALNADKDLFGFIKNGELKLENAGQS
jgi:kinetochore protein Spc25